MDFDELVDSIVEKAEEVIRHRGVVAIARQEGKKLKLVCIPINQNKKFWGKQEAVSESNPDSIERDFTFYALTDAAVTLAQLFADIKNGHQETAEEDTDDEDLALSENASGAYVLDACTVVSVIVNPYNQEVEDKIVARMME